mmetsp:Transcript_23952/g.45042  ORF Transcript_23952/g.45042 Transcript_23952/m.45042 type:complete len:203 (+) Transcript_23952:412-1020(+)
MAQGVLNKLVNSLPCNEGVHRALRTPHAIHEDGEVVLVVEVVQRAHPAEREAAGSVLDGARQLSSSVAPREEGLGDIGVDLKRVGPFNLGLRLGLAPLELVVAADDVALSNQIDLRTGDRRLRHHELLGLRLACVPEAPLGTLQGCLLRLGASPALDRDFLIEDPTQPVELIVHHRELLREQLLAKLELEHIVPPWHAYFGA